MSLEDVYKRQDNDASRAVVWRPLSQTCLLYTSPLFTECNNVNIVSEGGKRPRRETVPTTHILNSDTTKKELPNTTIKNKKLFQLWKFIWVNTVSYNICTTQLYQLESDQAYTPYRHFVSSLYRKLQIDDIEKTDQKSFSFQ